MALRPSPSRTASRQPEALDPSRCSTVGPNLAYTNYMALSTPLVRRWVRTPRGPANVPPSKPGYYAAHEIWPSSHHAPGVQHHLRPLRSSTAVGFGGKPWALEALEARREVSEGKLALDRMVDQKPAEMVPRMVPHFPPLSSGSRNWSQTALAAQHS